MTREPVIDFDHFSFRYASQQEATLKDIHLSINRGEKVLILGQSGSGKSTLIHCINGLIPYSFNGEITGSLKVAGMDTLHASIFALSKQVGTVLQDSDAQFVALSVAEDVAFALENQAIPREQMIPKVLEATDQVGMSGFLKQVPFTLSGGQKQKVALAGVLHEKVGILLFDEPLASLDPYSGMQTIELIDAIHNEDRTVLIVEHRLEDVLHRPVDRVIVMHEGQVVYDGKIDALLKADILAKYGLREPLYLQALRLAKVDLKQLDPIEDVHAIDFKPYRQALKAFGEPVHKSRRDVHEILMAVDHVTFAYEETQVIKDVSFSVRKGERIAFIGKNGAGKSTMAKLLTGVVRPDQGRITLMDQDLLTLSISEIGRRIGFVMQNPNQMLVKHLIKDEVSFALGLRKMTPEAIEERVAQSLKICGLYPMRNWPVSAVSYGQRKRITVAAILALDPDILILDEPTAGQDYAHYTEIMDFLDTLNTERNITFIFITHDMHLAIEYTDRALVFTDGQLIADDAIHTVLANPDIIEQAHLKQTSLYHLAQACGYPADSVIQHFIDHRSDL